MLYKIQQGDNLQSVSKKFGYTDPAKFFKIMRYADSVKAFVPGTIIEAPCEPVSLRDRPYELEDDSMTVSEAKSFVEGLTLRDVVDCLDLAVLEFRDDPIPIALRRDFIKQLKEIAGIENE